jgi:hypothetical protein
MDNFLESVYVNEIVTQCDWALGECNGMNGALAKKETGTFFQTAYNFLQHAAAASRLLWPPGKTDRAKKRGASLRASLAITDTGIVAALKGRTLRDHYEHYDERIDDWAETSSHRIIVTDMIGPRSAIQGPSIGDRDLMRVYDPATRMLWFRGELFDVQAIANAIVELRRLSVARLEQIDAQRREALLAKRLQAPKADR